MKCQILCSGKNKRNVTNLSSAELAQRLVKLGRIVSEEISAKKVLEGMREKERLMFRCFDILNTEFQLLLKAGVSNSCQVQRLALRTPGPGV